MRFSIVTRILLAFGVTLGVFGAVAVLSYLEIRSVGRELRALHHGFLPLLRRSAELESLQRQRQLHIDEIERQQDPQILRLLQRHYPKQVREKFAALLSEAREIAERNKVEAESEQTRSVLSRVVERVAAIAKRSEEATGKIEALLVAMRAGRADDVARLRGELKAEEVEQSGELRALTHEAESSIRQNVEVAQRREREGAVLVVAATGVALLMGLFILVFARRTLAPLRPLTDAVRRVAVGDYGNRVAKQGVGELAILAEEFNRMAQSLLDRDRKLAEQQRELIQSERLAAVGRIAAQIAHEVRNPLNALGLNAELVGDAIAQGDRDAAERSLRIVGREIDRLSEITEQYLAFARVPHGPKAVEDVGVIVGEVADLVEPECARRGIVVERRIAARALVMSDANAMKQVFLNLCRNAVEAMDVPEVGMGSGRNREMGTSTSTSGSTRRLRIEVAVGDGVVKVAVSDTGSGIAEENRERVFDPFFSTKVTGTGLGLPHARQIVREHGGTIACVPGQRDGKAVGTTFVVELPRAAGETGTGGGREMP